VSGECLGHRSGGRAEEFQPTLQAQQTTALYVAANRARGTPIRITIRCQHAVGIDVYHVREQGCVLTPALARSLQTGSVELVGDERVPEVAAR
jgi:hypothetical protein